MFKLKVPTKSTRAKLKEAGKQVPFAVSLALNDVAFKARQDQKKYLSRVLDAPIPFTLNGVLYDKATKRDLKAYVYLRDEVAKYLSPQIEGGTRNDKGLEVGLKSRNSIRGNNIPRGVFFIPTKAYQTGRGGNITKGKARKILEETKKKDGSFFLFIDDEDGRPLVFERLRGGKDVRLALIGVQSVQYKKRVKFYDQLERIVAKTFDKALNDALDRVLPESDK